jgi:hypothetical protein
MKNLVTNLAMFEKQLKLKTWVQKHNNVADKI